MIHEGDRRWSNIQIKYLQSWWEGKYELLDLGIFFSPFFCHNSLSFNSKSKQIAAATFFFHQNTPLRSTSTGWTWALWHCIAQGGLVGLPLQLGPGHSQAQHSIRLLFPCWKVPGEKLQTCSEGGDWHLHHANPPAADLPLTQASHSRFGVFPHDQESLLTAVSFVPLLILGHLNSSYCTLSILFPTVMGRPSDWNWVGGWAQILHRCQKNKWRLIEE